MDITITPNLVSRLKSSDEKTYQRIYSMYFPRLFYFSEQYVIEKEEAKSIVQDVFTELWANRKKLSDDTNIQSWLFTVTKNKSLKYISKVNSQKNYSDHIRRRQLELNFRALNQLETNNLVFDELKHQIEEALGKLSPACRKVFEKSRFEELKNKEIADQLNLSIKTVEAHISKALKILRTELKDYLPLLNTLFFLNI